MRLTWRQFFYSILLVSIVVLGYLNRDFLADNFVDPIARILWLIYRTFLSIDQGMAWKVLIIVAIIISLIMLPDQQEFSIRSTYRHSNEDKDRVAFWEEQFRAADKDANDRLTLQKNLQSLNRSIDEPDNAAEAERFALPRLSVNSWRVVEMSIRNLAGKVLQGRDGFEDRELEKSIRQLLDSIESDMEKKDDR